MRKVVPGLQFQCSFVVFDCTLNFNVEPQNSGTIDNPDRVSVVSTQSTISLDSATMEIDAFEGGQLLPHYLTANPASGFNFSKWQYKINEEDN